MAWEYETQSSSETWHSDGDEYRAVRYPQPPRSRDEWVHFLHSVFGGSVTDIECVYDATFGPNGFVAAVRCDIDSLPSTDDA